MMGVLFLITGFIFASILPFLNYSLLGFKGTVYYLIMTVFVIFVLAYVILSVFKAKCAKLEYISSKTIVGWNLNNEKCKKDNKPYYISLGVGVVFGIALLFNNVSVINSVLLSLAGAFTVLGWWLMGQKRFINQKNALTDFVLSHIGLIYNDEIQVFNGYSKGITDVKKEDNVLKLIVLKYKKETEISVVIPEDKISEVDDFILDMNNFFSGEKNEE